VPALAASLLMHAILLGLVDLQPKRAPGQPELVVTLTGTIAPATKETTAQAPAIGVPPPPDPVKPRLAPPPVPVAPEVSAPAAPEVAARATPEAPVAATPEVSVPGTPEVAVRATSDAPTARAASVPPQEATRPPVEQGEALERIHNRQLVGQRVKASVWVLADGSVSVARVTPYELASDAVALLEQALLQARFAPDPDRAAGAEREFRLLLCFDQAGRLETPDPECWPSGVTAPR
jgi:hypothetical protein